MVDKRKLAVGVGAGVLAAGAAAAGYYFYASKDAKKNRKILAKWASDMKKDVLKQAKKAKNLDRKQVMAIIDRVAEGYETVRNVKSSDIKRATRELRNNWQEIVGDIAKGAVPSSSKKRPAAKKHR